MNPLPNSKPWGRFHEAGWRESYAAGGERKRLMDIGPVEIDAAYAAALIAEQHGQN